MRALLALIAAVLAVLAVPLGAAAGAADEGTGEIGGQVTASATGEELAGVEVCAYTFESEAFEAGASEDEREGESEGSPTNCATTDASGAYAISDLPSGGYAVEFASPAESGLNYVTQYYDGKASPEEAQPVSVAAGQLTPGVDAEMQDGGRIAGRVTSSATSAPIEHVLVCALAAGGSESGCAVTNAGGEYTISALARGPFKVGFVAAGYALQFYDDAPSYAAARLVRLTAGETTAGIDAALTATPTPASPGAGATGAPSEIRRAARPALLTFTAARIVVSGGSAAAHVACRQAGCAGLLELATRVSARRRGEHPTSSARQQLVLARGSFSLSDGANATVILHLTGAGRRMLAHARHHPLAARLAARLKDGPAVSESVLVS